MPEKMTAEQLELMRSRKLILNNRLNALSELIAGRGAALAEFTADENGNISEEKVSSLISELIGCLNRRRRLEKRRVLGKKDEEMYRAFLYLAIAGLVPGQNGLMPPESFSDIIKFAEGLEDSGLKSYSDFLAADLHGFVTWYCSVEFSRFDLPIVGTFGILKYLVRDYMEHFVLYSMDRNEQARLCGEYAERFGMSGDEKQRLTDDVLYQIYDYENDLKAYDEYMRGLAAEEEAAQRAEYEKQVGEGSFTGSFEEYLSDLEPPVTDEDIERLSSDDSDYYNDTAAAWLETLDAGRFCGSYDKFAELYFKGDRSDFVKDISEMTDTFLFEHKLSAFSFGDDYLTVNYYLGRCISRIEKEIERRRG